MGWIYIEWILRIRWLLLIDKNKKSDIRRIRTYAGYPKRFLVFRLNHSARMSFYDRVTNKSYIKWLSQILQTLFVNLLHTIINLHLFNQFVSFYFGNNYQTTIKCNLPVSLKILNMHVFMSVWIDLMPIKYDFVLINFETNFRK